MPDNPIESRASLPPEIWLELVNALQPKCVLALEQTCRLLRQLLHRHETWIKILRRVCRSHGALLSTFPFEQMDLPHLQRAAMGPELYRRHIMRLGVPPIDLVDAPSAPHSLMVPDLRDILHYFVPGGRFLIAVPRWPLQGASIAVWDLGVPRGRDPRPAPLLHGLYSLHKSSDDSRNFVGCLVDETRIRVAVVSDEPNAGLRTTFRIVTITLGNGAPLFEEGPSIWSEEDRFNGISKTMTLTPRYLAFTIRRGVFFLWEYLTNRCAVWSTEFNVLVTSPTLTIVEEYLVYDCVSRNSLLVWNLATIARRPVTSHGPNQLLAIPENILPVVVPFTWADTRKAGRAFLELPGSSRLPGELVLGAFCDDDVYRWHAVDIAASWSRGTRLVTGPPPLDHPLYMVSEHQGDALQPFRLIKEARFPDFSFHRHSIRCIPDGVCRVDIFGLPQYHRGRLFNGGGYLVSSISDDEDEREEVRVVSVPGANDWPAQNAVCQISGRVAFDNFEGGSRFSPQVRIVQYA